MQLLIKLTISLAIILLATGVAKRFPSIAGLIGVMPLTGALIVFWVALENRERPEMINRMVLGALWGLVPTALFYAATLVCLKKSLPLPMMLIVAFTVWLSAACLHHWLLK